MDTMGKKTKDFSLTRMVDHIVDDVIFFLRFHFIVHLIDLYSYSKLYQLMMMIMSYNGWMDDNVEQKKKK